MCRPNARQPSNWPPPLPPAPLTLSAIRYPLSASAHAQTLQKLRRWLAEHAADPYVKRAHDEGWRSRAAFKLEEIQKSDGC